jgi:hypothetical protein
MFRLILATATILTALSLISCGTSSHDSKMQTRTGVMPSTGYPGGQPKDAESPALASSTETAHSNPIPKVPESEEHHESAAHEKK